MNTFYQTDRLIINILQPSWAPVVLNFYKKNKDILENLEPARSDKFYTESFQRANLSLEYNNFFKNHYMRYWMFDKKKSRFSYRDYLFQQFFKGCFQQLYGWLQTR